MNRDHINMLLNVAITASNTQVWTITQEQLERFAALVAAAEREACAKLCEEIARRNETENDYEFVIGNFECAAAIRARGNT
jgi:hypothetical protein